MYTSLSVSSDNKERDNPKIGVLIYLRNSQRERQIERSSDVALHLSISLHVDSSLVSTKQQQYLSIVSLLEKSLSLSFEFLSRLPVLQRKRKKERGKKKKKDERKEKENIRILWEKDRSKIDNEPEFHQGVERLQADCDEKKEEGGVSRRGDRLNRQPINRKKEKRKTNKRRCSRDNSHFARHSGVHRYYEGEELFWRQRDTPTTQQRDEKQTGKYIKIVDSLQIDRQIQQEGRLKKEKQIDKTDCPVDCGWSQSSQHTRKEWRKE